MSDPNTLPCGHPASMLLMSAETGKPLYCEYCDCIARRNDAEQREREQGGRIAALEAEVADARRACRDMENELSRKLARAAMTDAERMREVAALREERDALTHIETAARSFVDRCARGEVYSRETRTAFEYALGLVDAARGKA